MTKTFFSTVVSIAAFITLFVAKSTAVSATDTTNCEPIEGLGLNNLDRYNYSVDIDINDACSYDLKIMFKHDGTLPVPTNPTQCDPSIVPPAIASDGMPYFAFRWAYASVPKEVKKATGIDHVSIDFNPCGHPPVNVFTVPHYDVHIYLNTPEDRSCMTCTKIPGTPICDPGGQTTSNGYGKF